MAKNSAQLIAGMRARGWSYGQIGRLVGRNDRLIGQIAHGDKPGANLHGDLVRLARATSRVKDRAGYAKSHAKAFEPARRTTAEGTPAKVRGKTVTLPGGQTSVRGGKVGVTLRRRLQKAAREGRQVSFKVRYRSIDAYETQGSLEGGPIMPHEDDVYEADFAAHGWSAQAILDKLDEFNFADDPQGAFDRLISMNPQLEEKSGYRGYTLSTTARKR